MKRLFIILAVSLSILSCTKTETYEKDLLENWDSVCYSLYDSTYKISIKDCALELIRIDYPYHKNDSSMWSWYYRQIEIFNKYGVDSILVSKGLFELRRNQNTEGEKLGELKRWR